MRIRNLIILAFGLLPFFAASQTATFDRVRVRQGLTIRAEKADSIIRAITALSNHTSIPTAKAVWDAIAASVTAAKYQTFRDDGSNMTQQPNANFVSTGTVAFTLTNDAGNTETKVSAAVPADGITSTEILDGTIANADVSSSANIANSKLANSGVTAGTYPGTGGVFPQFTVNSKGILTNVINVPLPDTSPSNEGTLGVGAGGPNDAQLTSNTSGATGVTYAGGTAIGISEITNTNGGTITITNTGDTDGTNDLTLSDTVRTVSAASTHSKYPTALAVYNAITAGSSGPDSTFALAPGGGYVGKRITGNVYRSGKVSIGTPDTASVLNLREASATNDLNGALQIRGRTNGDSVNIFMRLRSSAVDSTEDLIVGAINSGSISAAGDNTSFYIGHNAYPGGSRINSAKSACFTFWEDNFINALPLIGNAPSYEFHHAFVPKNSAGNLQARFFSAALDHLGRTSDLALVGDLFTIKRFGQPYGFRPTNPTNWVTASFYEKKWIWNDSLTQEFDKNNIPMLKQRNAAGSALVTALTVDASDRVLLGGGSESNVAAYNSLQITNSGLLWNENGQIFVGKSGLSNSLYVRGGTDRHLTFQNSSGGNEWAFGVSGNDLFMRSETGGAYPWWMDKRAPNFSFDMGQNGSVNFGAHGYYPARLNVQATTGATTALFSMINSTGENAFFRGTASPEGVVAASPGDLSLTNVSGVGKAWLKTDGGSTSGWAQITTGIASQTIRSGELITVSLPTTVGDCVYIGNVTLNGGGGSGNITLATNVEPVGVGIAKKYEIPTFFAANANVWQTLLPISSSGAYSGSDFEVEIRVNGNVDSLRIRRTSGTAATSAKCAIFLSAHNLGDQITTYAKTWANAPAVSATYEQHAIAQIKNKVGIGVVSPATPLEVAGTIRSTGTGTASTLELRNTTGGTGRTWGVSSWDDGTLAFGHSGIGAAVMIDGTTEKVTFDGNVQLDGLSSATSTGLMGATSGNIATRVKLGAGLSFSNDTLRATGGGGSPGGSTTEVQYNNAGAFDGATGLTVDGSENVAVTQAVAFSGDITPSNISGTNNDYAPTGFSTASTLLQTNSSGAIVTGIAGGADGRWITWHNTGSENLIFRNENALSTAANRLRLGGGDLTLRADGTAGFRYDATASRWRLVYITSFTSGAKVYEFVTGTANFQLDIPAGAKAAVITAIGAGGGGGSGRKGAAGTVRCGGGGGAVGGYYQMVYPLEGSDAATMYINVGTGGTGGASVGANSTSGNVGGTGGETDVRIDGTATSDRIFRAGGGTGGNGGTAAAGAGGGATTLTQLTCNAGAAANPSGGNGTTTIAANNGTPGPAGAGGGITSANAPGTGSAGATGAQGLQAGGGGNGGNAAAMDKNRESGGGGGGGNGNNAGNATAGGNGVRGGGGGGGGAATDSVGNSGAGGNGGDGYVKIVFFF